MAGAAKNNKTVSSPKVYTVSHINFSQRYWKKNLNESRRLHSSGIFHKNQTHKYVITTGGIDGNGNILRSTETLDLNNVDGEWRNSHFDLPLLENKRGVWGGKMTNLKDNRLVHIGGSSGGDIGDYDMIFRFGKSGWTQMDVKLKRSRVRHVVLSINEKYEKELIQDYFKMEFTSTSNGNEKNENVTSKMHCQGIEEDQVSPVDQSP